ncbi:unnamed protein product [Closterium sp. NIES-53]
MAPYVFKAQFNLLAVLLVKGAYSTILQRGGNDARLEWAELALPWRSISILGSCPPCTPHMLSRGHAAMLPCFHTALQPCDSLHRCRWQQQGATALHHRSLICGEHRTARTRGPPCCMWRALHCGGCTVVAALWWMHCGGCTVVAAPMFDGTPCDAPCNGAAAMEPRLAAVDHTTP